ncbi:MAG: DUF1848 domain-containing protein [Deltaproteobacteria bacterium]|nr:DUF1848 domain-containing protein [Deltaproteobacteria bacterium]MBW2100624.1 DUF1848 domain-containing protein [Deltaproteobacteria bacterium]
MIISASRRTDIPAFYSSWFFNRIKEGFLYVRNPMNRKQISKIMLNKEVVDCIVFWTKNPKPMMDKLRKLSEYVYYFQYTLNPYGNQIEKNVPKLEKSIINFKTLSDQIGPDRIIWRYDPIFYTNGFNYFDHIHFFKKIAKNLSKYTSKCVISFLDVYKKCEKNMKSIQFQSLDETEMFNIARELSLICQENDIKIETCAEEIDLSRIGVMRGKCIDDELISNISHKNIKVKKDKTQRDVCGCVDSIDIGAYNSCKHNCIYCYANYDIDTVFKNIQQHDPQSALLYGHLLGDEKITERKMISLFDLKPSAYQMKLF